MLTQELLKELLHYNPETGDFKWRIYGNGRRFNLCAGRVNTDRGKSYIYIWIKRKGYRAHRLAFLYMEGVMPPNEVDHIDGNGLNNRWANLRHVTRQENNRNRRLYDFNKSGFTGVYWIERSNKWRAMICISGVNRHLGLFTTKSDAIQARMAANLEHNFHPNHGTSRCV